MKREPVTNGKSTESVHAITARTDTLVMEVADTVHLVEVKEKESPRGKENHLNAEIPQKETENKRKASHAAQEERQWSKLKADLVGTSLRGVASKVTIASFGT